MEEGTEERGGSELTQEVASGECRVGAPEICAQQLRQRRSQHLGSSRKMKIN